MNNNNTGFKFGVPLSGTPSQVDSPKKTYYPERMYEFVKNTLPYKVLIEGVRDIDALRQYYEDYLPKIGACLGWHSGKIKYHLEHYGMPEVEYWIDRMQREGYLP